MAFSSAPTNDTYSSHRVPLVCDFLYRGNGVSNGVYSGMVNVVPCVEYENGERKMYGQTRFNINGSMVTAPVGGNLVRGMYIWEKTVGTVYYFVVVGTKVYTSTTGLSSSWTNVTTLLTNVTTPVRFTEFIDSTTNTKSLVMVDGVEGYVFTSNAAGTKITDPDFPSPHIPFPVFLDGYLFLAKANTGDIYNSDLNTPSAWTAGNYISAEMYPDDVQALIRINNYILAVGTTGSEYFYDAGNSPGTPLARVEGATLPFGTLFPNLIAASRDTAVIFGNNGEGESKFRFVEGLKFKEMAGPSIPTLIRTILAANYSTSKDFRGFFLRQNSDLFYTFSTIGGSAAPGTSYTYPSYTYSFTAEIWSEFKSGSLPFTVVFSSPGTSLNNSTYLAGHYNSTTYFGTYGGGTVDNLAGTTYAIVESFVLPKMDFGTMNLKTMSRVAVSYSAAASESAANTDFTLNINDNDGSSSQFFSVMSTAGGNHGDVGGYPFWTQLGVFRSRQLTLYSSSNINNSVPKKYHFLEIDINKLQQ